MWRPKKPLNVTWVSIINSCKSEIRLAADYIVNETLEREGLNAVRTKHSPPPPPPAASLWRRESRARVERKRVGDNRRGKRGSEVPAFLLFPPSNARLLFFYHCCFHWNTQREPLQRRKNKTCSFLLLKHPLSCYNCLCYSNPLGAECMGPSRWLKEPRCQSVYIIPKNQSLSKFWSYYNLKHNSMRKEQGKT